MDNDLFRGRLVRLTMEDAKAVVDARLRWSRDTEYWHLQSSDIAMPYSHKQMKEWLEKEKAEISATDFFFMIQTLEDDRIIGDIELDGIDWSNGEGWVGIGIGERDYWGRGYGSDAMRILLRFAFQELNLHRITLDVFADNPRAMRSYEKVGFSYEGCMREFMQRGSKIVDLVHMGILREEWMRQQTAGILSQAPEKIGAGR